MDKTLKMYIGGTVAVILLLIIIDLAQKAPVNWAPTYSLDYKNPLDLYVFNNEIEKIIPEENLERVTVTPYEYLSEGNGPANYMVIHKDAYSIADSLLLEEVRNGSNLWISAENFYAQLTDSLKLKYTYVDQKVRPGKQDSMKLMLTMKNWKDKYLELKPALNFFCFSGFDTTTTTVLGWSKMPDGVLYPCFVRVEYGRGFIFLHSQPQVFSNICLLSGESSADYAAHILSYIPRDKPVVWFVQGQTMHTGKPINTTELSVIFRHPPLRSAWLILVYGMLLYILFNAKRRQRVVPVIRPLRNTTVEFVQTIGNLYFQEGSTTNIVEKKIIFFLDKIRHKYYLDTTVKDKNFAEKLRNKSGKDLDLINALLDFINKFEKEKYAEPEDLTWLNTLIEEFWEEEKN